MALFALSDLHLSLGADKPMDIFGPSWHNYTDRILSNWNRTVAADDLVIVGGDLSWATYLDEARADFEFLHSLPGKKLLIKGNHDYWWESVTKLKAFVTDNGFDSIEFLHNSAYIYEDFVIAGTRGWILPSSDGFGSEDEKIYNRELIRLGISLGEASKLMENSGDYKMTAVLHYPPVLSGGKADDGIMDVLLRHNVSRCIYGHLHGGGLNTAFCGNIAGVEFTLTSADYLDFTPVKIT